MPSPSEILSDPNFQGLPMDHQLQVMRTVDPNFAALHPKEQGSVIAKSRLASLGYDKIGEPPADEGFFPTLGKAISGAGSMIGGGIKNAYDILSPAAPGPARAQALKNVGDTVSNVAAAQHNQFEKGRQAFKQGDYVTGAGRTMAGALPVLGPMAAQAGEEWGDRKYGQAAANTAMLLVPEAAKLLPKTATIPAISRTVENVNNPLEESAIASVAPNVRMTPGQRAGQRGLQTSERDLLNKPGTATQAEEFFGGQQQDLASEGARRTKAQGGQVTNPYGAGTSVQGALGQRIQALKGYADKLYDSTRQVTARNVKEVQTGTRDIPASTILDPSGRPAIPAQTVPVMSTLESPVDLNPIRSQLAPIYSDLAKNLPEAKRANSPAFRALDELMNSDIQQMPAMDFDKFLGAVKSITRDGSSQTLSTRSQRLARQVIGAGESQFRQAIAGAGPNVIGKLQNARKAVREYHDTADFLDDLNSEPAALYSNLTTGGDRVRDILGVIGQKAPKSLQAVGRTYLEEMMDKATREGGFGRSAGVKADWEKLGPETKKLIFGPQVSKSMDEFLLAAKRLTPAVGSPTADRLSALTTYGDIGVALSEFMGASALGHPIGGALGAAAILGKTRVQPGILAKLSFKPAGAQLLKQAVTQAAVLPVNSPILAKTMRALNAMASDQEQQGSDDPAGLRDFLK